MTHITILHKQHTLGTSTCNLISCITATHTMYTITPCILYVMCCTAFLAMRVGWFWGRGRGFWGSGGFGGGSESVVARSRGAGAGVGGFGGRVSSAN